jgi:hypothetical protein
MVLMALCGLLVLLALAAVIMWGGVELQSPGSEPEGPPPSEQVGRRYLRYVTLAVVSGLGAGILMAGAGGRLVMRLLAVTAGDAAQGRTTEADEIVGQISAHGTIGFVVFTGLFFGLATGVLYLLVRRWLPGGRLGGLAFGTLLLLGAATRIDPLRAENPDFDIVGPGWLAVVVFSALVLAHGMLVAALAGRYSRVLPQASSRLRSLVAYTPLVLLIPVFPIALFLALVGIVAVALSRLSPLVEGLRSRNFTVAGRVVLTAIVLVSLPGFVSAVVDIAGRRQ